MKDLQYNIRVKGSRYWGAWVTLPLGEVLSLPEGMDLKFREKPESCGAISPATLDYNPIACDGEAGHSGKHFAYPATPDDRYDMHWPQA